MSPSTCSTGSGEPTRRARGAPAAPVSGSRSPSRMPACTAAGCRHGVSPGAAPASGSRCRAAPESSSPTRRSRWFPSRPRHCRSRTRVRGGAWTPLGCPTSTTWRHGDRHLEPRAEERGPIFPVGPAGPNVGDSPGAIVRGFLRAQATGFTDDFQFAVARQFLSDSARNKWDPLKGALVYASSSSPDVQLTGDNQVRVEIVRAGTLQPGGQFDEDSGASQSIEYVLQKDAAGQWRITNPDDGLVVSKADFDELFVRTTIYFPSSDGNYLVPDVRWFASRSVPTQVVRAVLGGPSAFLHDSARKVTADGVKLSSDAVTVTDGIAQVDLSAEETAAAPEDRALLKVQLGAVFQQLPKIQGVRINVGGVELSTPDPPQLVVDPQPAQILWYLADQHLVQLQLQGNPPTPVAAPGVDLSTCLLYTSDAADDLLCVDLGGRRIIKKKKTKS